MRIMRRPCVSESESPAESAKVEDAWTDEFSSKEVVSSPRRVSSRHSPLYLTFFSAATSERALDSEVVFANFRISQPDRFLQTIR